jgi:hypothetical protein
MEAEAQAEIDWCYTRSRDMWKDVTTVRAIRPAMSSAISAEKESQHRVRRASSSAAAFWAAKHDQIQIIQRDEAYGFDSVGVQAFGGGCCTCQRGMAGAPGQTGRDGVEGQEGNPGQFGGRGDDVPIKQEYLKKFPEQCPCESPNGPTGPEGVRGSLGQPGSAGKLGENGLQGDVGEIGAAGQPGNGGQEGRLGAPGGPGSLIEAESAPTGRPGQVGPPGGIGQIGSPGLIGKDGDNGAPGLIGDQGRLGNLGPNGGPGEQGEDGDKGEFGSCNECAPARLAPGY